MAIDIKLPPLGDNIDSGDVLEVKVREGDVIRKDQGLLELETDKATVEVPSSHAGKVIRVHVKDGQTVKIGAVLVTIEETSSVGNSATATGPAGSGAVSSRQAPANAPAPKPAAPVAATGTPLSPSKPAAVKPAPSPVAVPPKAPAPPVPPPSPAIAVPERVSVTMGREAEVNPAPVAAFDSTGTVAAGPAIRRFAREVGVDLAQVQGTGVGGRITREDVLAVVRQANEAARQRPVPSVAEATESDAWGPVRYEKMTKIRKTIAAKMTESWTTVPRVTNFDDADVTELERIRQSSKDDYAANGIKLTALPFVIKAIAMSLRKHPAVNASLDMEHERIVYKNYVNVGVAVDTERGLVVPALRDADKHSISEIARQLAVIAEKVRGGSFSVEDLRGSTFTISNLGAIGGTYSTPIINVPEVAILLVGRSRQLPVVVNDQVAVRLMMPLSLSYDHRLVDGATAARFLNDVIGFLQAPSRLLLAP